LLAVLVLWAPVVRAAGVGPLALDEIGQYDGLGTTNVVWTKAGANDTPNGFGFFQPLNSAIDAVHHRLFVADASNDRVLVYALASDNTISSKVPVNVLGQNTFYTNTAATTQAGNNSIYGLAYDATHDRLFVGDFGNNRVLIYSTSSITNGMNASNVVGQPNFTTSTSGTTQAKMSSPAGLAYDATNSPQGLAYDATNNRLFVAESGNNRVLVFNTTSITNDMNASNVLGEPDFTTPTAATTQAGMSSPEGLAYDATTNNLFVAELNNNRVSIYNTSSITNGMNASDLLGEYDGLGTTNVVWTKAAANNSPDGFGYSASSGMAIDAVHHRFFIADTNNNRVLVYTLASDNSVSSKVPVNVLGQPKFYTNTAATTQAGMHGSWGLAYDATNDRLFVGDSLNERVLVYNTASITNGMNASNVLGEPDFTTKAAATTQAGMNNPNFFAYDATNNRLFLADGSNNRVLVYNTASITNGMNASNVLGQASFTTATPAVTQAGMGGAGGIGGVAYDATNNRLFVADSNNNRVLVYSTVSITNGMNASNVLGEANFTTGTAATTQARMHNPYTVAYDATNNRLFVADFGNNRVLLYNTASITNGMNASTVLGQGSFTTSALATTQTGMSSPYNVTYDPGTWHVYVADGSNRVLIFDASIIHSNWFLQQN